MCNGATGGLLLLRLLVACQAPVSKIVYSHCLKLAEYTHKGPELLFFLALNL